MHIAYNGRAGRAIVDKSKGYEYPVTPAAPPVLPDRITAYPIGQERSFSQFV